MPLFCSKPFSGLHLTGKSQSPYKFLTVSQTSQGLSYLWAFVPLTYLFWPLDCDSIRTGNGLPPLLRSPAPNPPPSENGGADIRRNCSDPVGFKLFMLILFNFVTTQWGRNYKLRHRGAKCLPTVTGLGDQGSEPRSLASEASLCS